MNNNPQQMESEKGTYIALKVEKNSVEFLQKYLDGIYTLTDDLHITLIYSRTCVNNVVIDPSKPYVAFPKKYSVFGTDNKVIVLEIDSDDIKNRHNQIMNDNPLATYDFETYQPHITLVNNPTEEEIAKLDTLRLPEFPILLNSEYIEDLTCSPSIDVC